jgi:hypothetical protein
MFNNTDLQRAYIKMGGLFPKILATNSKIQTHISTAPPSGIVLSRKASVEVRIQQHIFG